MKYKKTHGLKYCNICQQVWEWDRAQVRELKYPVSAIPSFGLEREDCSECKGTSPGDADTPATMAQKAAAEHQELYTKYVKKHSK